MVTKNHFWRQIFGICEKFDVNSTAIWSQNNTKMTVLAMKTEESLNIVLDSQKYFYLNLELNILLKLKQLYILTL